MLEPIKRLFAHWNSIPKHKVPRWVRGKLYNHSYVQDRAREYKVSVEKHIKKKEFIFDNGFATNMGNSGVPSYSIKKWKEVSYSYRVIN